jgi:hypothetical protein
MLMSASRLFIGNLEWNEKSDCAVGNVEYHLWRTSVKAKRARRQASSFVNSSSTSRQMRRAFRFRSSGGKAASGNPW